MQTILDYCKDSEPELFNSGELLLTEGSKSGNVYILLEGKVEIIKGDMVINSVSDPGAIFGEMSVLLDLPHMASVKTVEPSKFYVFTNTTETIFNSDDISWQLATVLAGRLHNITNFLVDLKKRSTESEEQLGMVCEVLEKYIYQNK